VDSVSPESNAVAVGESVTVVATPDPVGQAFPSGYPTWNMGGSAGATSTVTISTVGTNTVSATCGTSSQSTNVIGIGLTNLSGATNVFGGMTNTYTVQADPTGQTFPSNWPHWSLSGTGASFVGASQGVSSVQVSFATNAASNITVSASCGSSSTNLAISVLAIEIREAWSDQLSGVTDANYLPNKTGQADRAYLLMGACQNNNFDLKGHLKAKVNVGSSPELRSKILWRLAGKSGSTYTPENGTSTYNANGDEVTIVLDNPRTDDDNSYYLVAGYDQDGNGQLSSSEASVVPKYKWKRKVNGQIRTDDHDYEVKIVSRSRYDEAQQSLNSLAGTWDNVGLRQASRLMSAFLNEQTPTGASAVPVLIGRDEPGLTHSVGVLFAAPGNPGQSITATFAPVSEMTADVLDSTTLNNWLSDKFDQKRDEVTSRFQNSEEVIETFTWNFESDLSFSVASDPDLFFALGRTKINITVEVEVHRFLYTVESTRITGSITDLYDFDYDDQSGYAGYGDFVRKASRAQAGYNTIGTGGRVYKSNVQMSNSPHPILFQFQ